MVRKSVQGNIWISSELVIQSFRLLPEKEQGLGDKGKLC
jgi:hypothetical protein